jgi:hypothetical protein
LLTDFVAITEILEVIAKGTFTFSNAKVHCNDQELLGVDEIEQLLTRFGKNATDLKKGECKITPGDLTSNK